MLEVFRMNHTGSGPFLQLLTRFAEILQDLLVNKLYLTRWVQRVYEPGDVIDDRAKIGLALQQFLLGTLAIINVCKKEVPRGYFVVRVSHRKTAYLEPSVYSIRTPATVFYVVNTTLFDRLNASRYYAGKVIRMNGIRQRPVL